MHLCMSSCANEFGKRTNRQAFWLKAFNLSHACVFVVPELEPHTLSSSFVIFVGFSSLSQRLKFTVHILRVEILNLLKKLTSKPLCVEWVFVWIKMRQTWHMKKKSGNRKTENILHWKKSFYTCLRWKMRTGKSDVDGTDPSRISLAKVTTRPKLKTQPRCLTE